MSSIPKNQAPNMYIDLPSAIENDYDMLLLDFRCDNDGLDTFYNVHYYKLNSGSHGYAGFLNSNGDHKIILSIWEYSTKYPTVEYVSPYTIMTELLFSGEGNGKHIITDFGWQTGIWYTMCICTKTLCGKTFVYQWIRKCADNEPWLLCAILSYPEKNKYIDSSSFFIEDYSFNNVYRRCSLKAYYGRKQTDGTWHSRSQFTLSNRYYPYLNDGSFQDNVNYDCGYELISGSTVFRVKSGGEDLINPVPHTEFVFPYTVNLTQSSAPDTIPLQPQIVPHYIKSTESSMVYYISLNSSNTIIRATTKYYWIFVDTEDDFFYILNKDKTLAITLGTDGVSISMQPFIGSDWQKWTKHSYPQSENVHFAPKSNPYYGIRYENGSYGLSIFNVSASKFRFVTYNAVELARIKSQLSLCYISPSGNNLIQKATAYSWLFIPVDGTYYYILTRDCMYAITVNGVYEGADLSLALFDVGNQNQMWKFENAPDDGMFIIPKTAPTMGMDIEGAAIGIGAVIQLSTYNSTHLRFRWEINIVRNNGV